jgi:CubicO group peptidase (beta-lactamase class C family)
MQRTLLLLAFVFIASPCRAAEFDAKAIDTVVEKAMKEFQVPGAAVVIVKGDEVIYLRGFGVREKGKPEPVTPNTVFPIASCTKAFTTTALAMLVDEEKLSWDDKVHKHLDYFRLSDELADREVTLRDLVSHRTGMPRHDMIWAGQEIQSEELIHRWMKAPPSTSFRSTWEYSNVPFTTAGLIGGRIEGGSWQNLIEKRIFAPLEMNSSSCKSEAGRSAEDHATPHYFRYDKTVSPVKWDEIDHAGGAGCINSTASDMGRWLKFLLAGGKFDGKRLISARALRETQTPQMLVKQEGVWLIYFPTSMCRFTSYGLGWFVHDYRGHTCVSHGGTLTGSRAQCMLIPDKKIGVFVVCNLRPSFLSEAVARTVLDHLLELPAEDWVAATKTQLTLLDLTTALNRKKRASERAADRKPSLPMKKYAGSYDEPAYGKAQVAHEGEHLTLRWGKMKFRLEHYHYDTFTAIPVEPADEVATQDRATYDVLFQLGTNGEVEMMKFLGQNFTKGKKK